MILVFKEDLMWLISEDFLLKNLKLSVNKEFVIGLSFIYENYIVRRWYWELIEMVCKFFFMLGLILIG